MKTPTRHWMKSWTGEGKSAVERGVTVKNK